MGGRKSRLYNIELYRRIRSAIERFFGWLKSFRRITIRYERLASTYKALVTIASIIIHLIRNFEMSSIGSVNLRVSYTNLYYAINT